MPLALVRIDIVPHLSGISCIAEKICSGGESNLKGILEAPQINGFYPDKEYASCNKG